jgi:hypothetical protein
VDKIGCFQFLTPVQKVKHLHCKSCLLTLAALIPLIRLLFFSFNIDDNTITQLMKDPHIRKCMLNVVKGIANFGVRYPQPAGAPVTIVWNFTNRCNYNCLHCHQDSSPMTLDFRGFANSFSDKENTSLSKPLFFGYTITTTPISKPAWVSVSIPV